MAETPMMKQYMRLKARFPDKILFYRMGDFYEMFHEDAKVASQVLGLALTSRSKGDGAVPMAGIPHHSADTYIRRLIKAGHNVAICEQVEDPATAQGLVDRDIVRVITPGTYTDEKFLDSTANNYLLAIAPGRALAGIAWADLSTGEFFVCEVPLSEVPGEVRRISPNEMLIAESVPERYPEFLEKVEAVAGSLPVARRPDWEFEREGAYRSLTSHFGTSNLAGFGVEDFARGVGAAGAVLAYLDETQKGALGQIRSIKPVRRENCLLIDANAVHSLELTETQRLGEREGSLLAAIDSTKTAMGSRLLRSWLLAPLAGPGEINRRLEAVAELKEESLAREQFRTSLGRTSDLSRLAARVASGRCSPRDLVGIARVLALIPELSKVVPEPRSDLLSELLDGLDPLDEVRQTVEKAIGSNPPPTLAEGGVIRAGYSAELDELLSLKKEGHSWVGAYQASEIERTGIRSLKVGYNRVFGYYIEITNTYKDKVPPGYVRKQTLKNAERYITEELKTHEEKVLTASQRAVALEQELFREVREKVAEHTPALQKDAWLLSCLDVLCAFAHTASERRYAQPVVDDSLTLDIKDGRHPVLDLGGDFVPNDTLLDTGDNRLTVITGPNMAGKSTYIRQVALLVIMAQMGSFVPAASMRLGVVDRICTRIGASDDLVRGKSTFMVEMNETANILNNATERSLIILDEVGRGTSTYDGLSLAWAVAEFLSGNTRARTLFATHYHRLTDLARACEGVRNFNVAVREWGDEVVFLHKIVEGASDRSYGIHVARLAGIPGDVISRAVELLGNIEAESADSSDMPSLLPEGERLRAQQLPLFVDPREQVAKKLRSVDIDLTTPLEALNILRMLRELLGPSQAVPPGD